MMEPAYAINPSRRKPIPPNIKKPVPDWHVLVRTPMSDFNPRKSNLEKAMDEDLAELRIVMDMFLNGRMNEGDSLLRGRDKPESLYYSLGISLADTLRAGISFRRDDIENAMKSYEVTLKVASAQRKKSSSITGVGAVKAIGSWVSGNVGANSFKGMTRLEKHAELVYAETLLLKSAFSVLYHEDFWSLAEESVSFRSAFAIFNGLKCHFEAVEQELKAGGDISEYYLDEHLVSGLIFSYSLFNIVLSFMPTSILKILHFVGFPSDRDWGLALLNTAGQWDQYSGSYQETPFEFQERLKSRTNDGIRRQLCDIAAIAVQVVAASFLPFRNVDYEFAEQVNNYNLHKYPDSPFFLFMKARHAQVNTRLEEAIAIHETIKVQPEWKNLGHASIVEQVMCAIMIGDYDLACTKSRILLRESNWSKAVFRYLAAITTMKRGWPKEAKRVPELMKKVEAGMQSFCGVEVFAETYCARKANRYLKENHLLLPDYDFLVLWNGFDMMPLTHLRVALSNIMVEVQRLDAHLPPSMAAIADKPLPRGGYTLEAAKVLLSTIRSGIHTLTKEDKVKGYGHFYDDYCIAHYLLGIVAQKIALFPGEPFDIDMCTLAVKSYKTVFRYAPYVKDDTYMYYFSHYNIGVIMMSQGRFELAEEKFKYLLNVTSPTLSGLPSLMAGKGRNSLDAVVLARAHAAMFLLDEDRANSSNSSPNTSVDGKSSPSSLSSTENVHESGNSQERNDRNDRNEKGWSLTSDTAMSLNGINATLGGMTVGGATTASTGSRSDRGSVNSGLTSSTVIPVPSSPKKKVPASPTKTLPVNPTKTLPVSPINTVLTNPIKAGPASPINPVSSPVKPPVRPPVNLPNSNSPYYF